MQNIGKTNVIQSDYSTVNHVAGHENLTFYSERYGDAVGYAQKGGVVPGTYAPTFDRPSYLIVLKNNNTFKSKVGYKPENSSGEIGINGGIEYSKENIESIIEVRPHSITEGIYSLPYSQSEDDNQQRYFYFSKEENQMTPTPLKSQFCYKKIYPPQNDSLSE